MKKELLFLLTIAFLNNVFAQQAKNWDVYFGSVNERYQPNIKPNKAPDWKATAWKGETVHTQIVIWNESGVGELELNLSALKSKTGNSLPQNSLSVYYLDYTLTNGLNPKGLHQNCGLPDSVAALSIPIADALLPQQNKKQYNNKLQPVWLSVQLPADAAPGIYNGTITVSVAGKTVKTLPYSVKVLSRSLPNPGDYAFHLDLWQSPYSIARWHNVPLWSDAHFSVMRPYFQMLADAGQKVATASIINDPWNSQTYDVYGSMIKWIKKSNGSWEYDYTIFDKWISFLDEMGINKQISCFSMIPWNLKFYYFDEALGKDTLLVAKPQEPAYREHWLPMLKDFVAHLKQKGWYNKTTIAMDERAMQDMQAAIAIIKEADKDFKVSLAGTYHKEIEADLVDYCITSSEFFPADVLQARKTKGFKSTYYTCCVESFPNTFTFSPPAESAYIGIYAAAKNFDGYLRWAYNLWPEQPFDDSRFAKWPSGDTYLVYPHAISSIRFERLIEGIQTFEKIRLLKEDWTAKNNLTQLAKLNNALSKIEIKRLQNERAEKFVDEIKGIVNVD